MSSLCRRQELSTNFCYVANEVYKGDLAKMKDEIFMVSNDLTEFFNKCLEDNFTTEKFPSNEPYMRFITIPNGRYLTFDVRDAVPQTLLHYNIMSETAFNDIYSKYEHGEILKKCKWITHKAFFRSIVPHREKYGHNFPKQLIIDTINSDDPIFSQFKNDKEMLDFIKEGKLQAELKKGSKTLKTINLDDLDAK